MKNTEQGVHSPGTEKFPGNAFIFHDTHPPVATATWSFLLEPWAVAVSPYGWLMNHYGWLAG